VWQSAHIVPQAVYRTFRAASFFKLGRIALGLRVSEGRAFTTLLLRAAHAAFDRSWIREWGDAVEAG